jgi:hypothetical protein
VYFSHGPRRRLVALNPSSAGNAKEVRILNIFSLEYLVLFLMVLAAGYKALKALRADGRNGEPPEKKVSGKKRTG